MNVKEFFTTLGGVFGKAFTIIHKVVPEKYLVAGIEYVAVAALKFTDNADKKAWVATQLKGKFPISDSVANLIVEIAVQHLKEGERKLADKAEEFVQKDN